MIEFYPEPSEEEDLLFSNINFSNPMIFFQDTDYKEVVKNSLNNGLIPITKITDKDNQVMIDVENSKPPQMKNMKVECIIFAITYKQNYWA